MQCHWLIIPVSALLLGVGPAYADEEPEWRAWPLGNKVGLQVGSFFANMETTVRVDATNGMLGSQISFERDLGLDDSKTRPMVNAYWRFFERHRLDFYYFNLDRSGDSISSVDIRFGDQVFQANLPLQFFFDVEIFNLGYSYSLLFDEKKDWSVGLALSFQELGVGMRGTVAGQPLEVSESDSVLAPLPTFTTRFAYALTPKWVLDASAGYFTIGIDFGDGELDGDIISTNVGVRWKPVDYLSFGLMYQFFEVDVDVDQSRLHWAIDYQYDGPALYVGTRF